MSAKRKAIAFICIIAVLAVFAVVVLISCVTKGPSSDPAEANGGEPDKGSGTDIGAILAKFPNFSFLEDKHTFDDSFGEVTETIPVNVLPPEAASTATARYVAVQRFKAFARIVESDERLTLVCVMVTFTDWPESPANPAAYYEMALDKVLSIDFEKYNIDDLKTDCSDTYEHGNLPAVPDGAVAE